jgi:mono/diheme cytochrome c family protein
MRMAALAAAAVAVAAPVAAGAFSAAQADRGLEAYKGSCALCHGEAMGGGAGVPPLTGPEFAFGWNGKPTAELFDYARTNMPPGQAGALTDQQYADVVAAILRKNGEAAGGDELAPGSETLKAPMALKP